MLITFTVLLFTFSMFTACPDPPTEHTEHTDTQTTTITLEEVETGVTGTKLNVAVEDSANGWTFELTRNDSVVLTQTVYQKDTLIMDNGLTPTTTYNYKAYWLDGLVRKDSSKFVTVTTGDTTSHNFIWEIDTLGEYGSYLNDVAIVNENDIWVVGNIETDTATYNAAHWDGNEWELKQFIYSPSGIVHAGGSIQVFDENNIIIVAGTIFTWDGIVWEEWNIEVGTFPGGINAIWGTSSDNMYFVGYGGSIVHYGGTSFELMESGTDVNLKDIDGTEDGEYLFAVGRDNNYPSVSTALMYSNGSWETIYLDMYHNEGEYGWMYGVGVLADTVWFSTGTGIWKYNYITNTSIFIHESICNLDHGAFKHVRIQSANDIFIGGAGFMYNHYNGASFYKGLDIYNMFPSRACYGSDYNGNIAMMVGHMYGYNHAMIARGYHQ